MSIYKKHGTLTRGDAERELRRQDHFAEVFRDSYKTRTKYAKSPSASRQSHLDPKVSLAMKHRPTLYLYNVWLHLLLKVWLRHCRNERALALME